MKALGYLVVALIVFALAVGMIAASGSSGSSNSGWPVGGVVSHEQLDQDRLMTQQMATDVGPAMQAGMPAQGMLARSADPAYVRALEQHQRDLDRMLARQP